MNLPQRTGWTLKITKLIFLVSTILSWNACEDVFSQSIHRTPETNAAIQYIFSPEEEALLEEIQRGCFEFLWKEVGDPIPLVKDRLTNNKVSSLGGVGFQLSALPIGVERGWITREQGAERALKILRAIVNRDDNKKLGIYLHYVDLNTGGMHFDKGAQVMASTVDHALLQAGAMPAGVYFGGEVAKLVDQIINDANWKAYEVDLNENIWKERSGKPEKFISFGWRPEGQARDVDAPGNFRPWSWYKASDEELLVNFLAVGSPNSKYKVEPDMYYRLHRVIKGWEDLPPFVVSWSGTAFNYMFAHCWIDYKRFGTDDPQAFGSEETPVDWFENSRRALITHRQRCLEAIDEFKSFGPTRWGMSAAADVNQDGTIGYIVQSIRPSLEDHDNFCGGTVTPYVAGMATMFMPKESVAALHEFRHLRDAEGNLVAWRALEEGGYGLLDSFNLDRETIQGTPDYLSIDDGPMILGIENARTGLIWDLFMQHPSAKLAVERLKLK